MKNLAGKTFLYEKNFSKLSTSDSIIKTILLNAAKNDKISNIAQFKSKLNFTEFCKKNNFSSKQPKKKKIFKNAKIKSLISRQRQISQNQKFFILKNFRDFGNKDIMKSKRTVYNNQKVKITFQIVN